SSRRRRHTRFSRDWSSDVCSSDLSTKFGKVTFRFGSASIARLIAKTAPSFLAHLLREIPLFTSQKSIDFKRCSASLVPSRSIPKPPLITSPQPTPPPL